jgi:hypothetical protein
VKRLYRRAGTSKTVTRLVPVVVLAALIFSMLPTFLPVATGAQDGDLTTPVAEVQEQADAPPEETVESVDPAETSDPTETPTVAPETQIDAVSAYIAEARGCPAGFDPAAGDASMALAACVDPLPGIAFTLAAQHPNYSGDTRATGGDGIAAWTDIPLGAGYSVSAAIPQSTGAPWVYCELTGGSGGDQYLFFPASGGRMDLGLSDPSQAG